MTRVLVTGGSGFIGSHLVEALRRRGDQVACLVRPTSKRDRLKDLGLTLVEGDVTDRASLAAALDNQDSEVVYHVAGLTRALRAAELVRVNGEGVANVAAACADRSTSPKLLLVSSLAAAGPVAMGGVMTETDPAAPVSVYGRSKLAGEEAAQGFAGRVPITIVRPPVIFGPRDRDVLQLFRLARRGVFPVAGRGGFNLALLHVTDLVEGLILAAERGERLSADGAAGHGCYFVAAETAPTLADLGGLLGEAVGRPRVRVVRVPGPVARLSGGVADVVGWLRRRPPRLGRDKVDEALAGSWDCATDKARTQLGFTVGAPLPQRLNETAAWYRHQGWL